MSDSSHLLIVHPSKFIRSHVISVYNLSPTSSYPCTPNIRELRLLASINSIYPLQRREASVYPTVETVRHFIDRLISPELSCHKPSALGIWNVSDGCRPVGIGLYEHARRTYSPVDAHLCKIKRPPMLYAHSPTRARFACTSTRKRPAEGRNFASAWRVNYCT